MSTNEFPGRLANCLDRATNLLLGEENLRMQAHQVPRNEGVASYSCGRSQSYQVSWGASGIVIRPRNRWNFLTGFFPFYRFKGTYLRNEDNVELSGRVVMVPFVKTLVLIWIGGLLLAWILAIGIASYTTFEFIAMHPEPDISTKHRLMVASMIIGIAPVLAGFGASILGIQRAIKRKEKQGLIEFCKRFAEGNAT